MKTKHQMRLGLLLDVVESDVLVILQLLARVCQVVLTFSDASHDGGMSLVLFFLRHGVASLCWLGQAVFHANLFNLLVA